MAAVLLSVVYALLFIPFAVARYLRPAPAMSLLLHEAGTVQGHEHPNVLRAR